MSERPEPLLVLFASPPRAAAACGPLYVNSATGLLHEAGATAPLIEEVIASGRSWQGGAGAETPVMRATDPSDPDLIRGDSGWLRLHAAVSTFFTKGDLDPVDPDLVRAHDGRFIDAVGLALTRAVPDTPSPT